MMEALVILFMLGLIWLMLALVAQSLFAVFNERNFQTSEHVQETLEELVLEKKITKEETDPLAIATLSSVWNSPMFFAWGKDQKFALVFESNIAVSVSEEDYKNAQVGNKFKLKKKTIRRYFSRTFLQRPWLLNLILNNKYGAESKEEIVKYEVMWRN